MFDDNVLPYLNKAEGTADDECGINNNADAKTAMMIKIVQITRTAFLVAPPLIANNTKIAIAGTTPTKSSILPEINANKVGMSDKTKKMPLSNLFLPCCFLSFFSCVRSLKRRSLSALDLVT